jgi:hypothetical protein
VADRELLEAAARAAGFVLPSPVYSHLPSGGCWIVGPRGQDVHWNPLHDDADAFRLAVKLKLWVRVREAQDGHDVYAEVMEGDEPDDDAATRRAIVLAAAQLGANMSTTGTAT